MLDINALCDSCSSILSVRLLFTIAVVIVPVHAIPVASFDVDTEIVRLLLLIPLQHETTTPGDQKNSIMQILLGKLATVALGRCDSFHRDLGLSSEWKTVLLTRVRTLEGCYTKESDDLIIKLPQLSTHN